LKDNFALVTQGKGKSLIIAAPAGVGKSRLIQEFRLRVKLAKVPFMEGRCFEQGMTAYQPLAEAFKPLLPLTKKEVVDKYGSVLMKVIPELKEKGYPPAPKLDEVGEKVRLFEQITGWLKEISKATPIVICIEDLHWSDFATSELINACVRELRDYPIMILGAFRDDEIEPTSIIFQTVEEGITQLIKLSTLNQDDVQLLVKGMLGRIELTEDFTEHIYTATAGNAFFVSETMRVLIEEEQLKLDRGRWILPVDISALELPTSIEVTILRRLKLISSDALELAHIAAVIGRSSDLSFLKSLSNLEVEKLFERLNELVEHQFMKTENKQYVFTHDRVRETLYKQIKEPERQILHEKCGNILEYRYLEHPESIVNALAYHFCQSGNKPKAVKYLLAAGEQALQRSILGEATRLLKQGAQLLEGIDYPDKDWLLRRIWDNLIVSSLQIDTPTCKECCEKLLKALYGMGNIPRFLKLMKSLYKIIDFLPEGLSWKIKIFLDKTEDTEKKPPRGWLANKLSKLLPDYSFLITKSIVMRLYLATATTLSSEYDKAVELFKEIEDDLPDKKSFAYACVLVGRALPLLYLGYMNLAQKEMQVATAFFKSHPNDLNREYWWMYSTGCWEHEMAVVWQGKPLTELTNRGYSISTERAFLDSLYWTLYNKMAYFSQRGMKKETENLSKELWEILKKVGHPPVMETAYYAELASVSFFYGEMENAISLSELAFEKGSVAKDPCYRVYSKVILGLLAFENHRIEDSISLIREAIAIGRDRKVERLISALYSLGEIYLKLDNLDESALLIEEAHTLATSQNMENHYYQINTYRLLGQLSQKQRTFEKAIEYLQKSLELAKLWGNPAQEGLTSFALGELYADLAEHSLAKKFAEEAKGKFKELDNIYQYNKVCKFLDTIREF